MKTTHFLAATTLLAGLVASTGYAWNVEESNCDGAIENFACTGSEVPVADFSEVLCAVPDDLEADCPSEGEAYYGQDANYEIDPDEPTVDGIVWKESVTGLWWTTAADAADSLDAAEQVCAGYASSEPAGTDDWRVPTMRELSRIISKNQNYAPTNLRWPVEFDAPENSTWWTSTPAKGLADFTITISGNWPGAVPLPTDGTSEGFTSARYVYCVSGPAMGGQWQVDETLNVVVHTTTQLTWQRDPQSVDAWSDALAYCEGATTGDFDDWRLPSIREALSMLDPNPASDNFLPPGFTPDARSDEGIQVNFYSSTPYWLRADFTEIGTYREDSGTFPFHYHHHDSLENLIDTAARCVRGPVAAPEPSAALLGATALGFVAALRRRPRSNEPRTRRHLKPADPSEATPGSAARAWRRN